MSDAHEDKKEKVLHTRVPSGLDDELRTKAANLGISVSNLVRNILNNSVNLVEDVIMDSSKIGQEWNQQGEGNQTQPNPAASANETIVQYEVPSYIVGWQDLRLERNAVCESCNEILPRGTQASIAIKNTGLDPKHIVCGNCSSAAAQSSSNQSSETGESK